MDKKIAFLEAIFPVIFFSWKFLVFFHFSFLRHVYHLFPYIYRLNITMVVYHILLFDSNFEIRISFCLRVSFLMWASRLRARDFVSYVSLYCSITGRLDAVYFAPVFEVLCTRILFWISFVIPV
ncbi:MAG: hypothetical protein A3B90_03090 [Candidatus Magasanikbacteria bacterium RIFCSPHIGHO2_02_FULL_41_13]|uniref:Uncharacterized protein n=1 Tax=Candidatus Magasanikbacteria bacterium RIFCSPHIGHO2_02_FULL_41_13 TaxID=1798676 RepID=A0A1F6M6Y0_9BACT|nr:MAG: hypothetical protein A3B90_03090 [Candidatus Magasanikbacteria bacterium RIFCSPHIGHO2_02_FULL_41_13]